MATSILRLPAVKARTGLSRSSIYSKIASGEFPVPIRLGGAQSRAVGFLESEIDDWLSRRARTRVSPSPRPVG